MYLESEAVPGAKLLKVPNMLVDYFRTALALKIDKRAVTAIEYALIASLVAVVIVSSVAAIGSELPVIFNKVSTEL